MSKFEANEFVDDRYAKMAERLEVRRNRLKHRFAMLFCRNPAQTAITCSRRPLLTC